MATRLKTVEYAFPVLASVTNDTLTNFTQTTVYLPDIRSGSGRFHSVELRITADDQITAIGGSVTTKTINLRLGAVAYTSTTNANILTHSAQSISHLFVRDFTDHFNTNWTGTSMTCDAQMQINQSTGTPTDLVNACARLYITYEYDDTITTQVKTVYIPLNAPTTHLASARPASALDTIPAIDTYLPEASKTYRDLFVWFGVNTSYAAAGSTKLSFQIDADTAYVTETHENGPTVTSRWIEHIWKPTFDTSATREFRAWESLGGNNAYYRAQVYMVVTYEFNATTTTSAMNSLLLPMEWESPGGTSTTIFQRATRELMIQEPSTITTQRVALYVNFETPISLAGDQRFRVGTGSWITYTDSGAIVAGQKGCMVRNDSAFTLARGRNTLQADSYSSSVVRSATNISSYWIVNYTSGIATGGIGTHNRTVFKNLHTHGTGAAIIQTTTTSQSFLTIPETSHYIVGAGTVFEWFSNSTANPTGVIVQAERTAGEGGLEFESVYVDVNACDPEPGTHSNYSQVRSLFKRFVGDADADRLQMSTSRRYRTVVPNIAMTAASSWHLRLASIVTYHTITSTFGGTISNSNGGTVIINLCRASTGERLMTTSRVGNGTYSFVWYDNTEDLYTEAYEDGTFKGRSGTLKATIDV